MRLSRREVLRSCGAGAAAWATAAWVPLADYAGQTKSVQLPLEKLRELGAQALTAAAKLGATYADIRINRYRTQALNLRSQQDLRAKNWNAVPSISESESSGFGVRVVADGAWGFAASYQVGPRDIDWAVKEAIETAKANARLRREPVKLAPTGKYKDSYQTPMVKDPFGIPVREKLALLHSVAEEARKVAGIFAVNAMIAQRMEHRFFMSSEGSEIDQSIYQIAPEFSVTAVERGKKQKTRTYRPHAVTAGYEAVERAQMLKESTRVAEEVINHLRAAPVSPGRKDLVLLPTHLALTIHESIGHSTELDRALGYEANFAGTSFLTPDKLGKFKVAAEILSFNGDRIRRESLSTCGYDDDGVKTKQFPIIKNGIFVGYQTIRDQAHLIGQSESTACCYADSYASVPFQRMPNVWLEPSSRNVKLADLVSGVDDGILIDGRGSYSIDHQRYNFQFGGDAFWEIKNGKLGSMIADVAYQSRTPDFWSSCDGIGGADTWENVGLNADGKGEPQQLNAMSHGCPPARFRQVNVLRTG